MYRYAIAFSATLLAVSAFASVRAEEAHVSYPFLAGSLHAGGVDMVYYVDPSDAVIADLSAPFDVYATFLNDEGQRTRHRFTLSDGDRSGVTMPGQDLTYYFWRRGTNVHALVETNETVAEIGQ